MAILLKRPAMASKLAARDADADPTVDVIDAIETRATHESRIRVRSARRRALEIDDEHERPTLVPAEPIDPAALEARVLYESRAVIERRLALATQQDLQATRRIDAVDIPEREDRDVDESVQPVPSVEEPFALRISVDTCELDEAFERRRSRVRAFALTMMLAFVITVAVIAFRR